MRVLCCKIVIQSDTKNVMLKFNVCIFAFPILKMILHHKALCFAAITNFFVLYFPFHVLLKHLEHFELKPQMARIFDLLD